MKINMYLSFQIPRTLAPTTRFLKLITRLNKLNSNKRTQFPGYFNISLKSSFCDIIIVDILYVIQY